MTFREVADMYVAAHEAGWRSQKHIQLWHSTLRDYVLPAIGNLPVASVDTGAVIKIIEPVWRERTTTASRVRGRIESVLDYAKARGWFQGHQRLKSRTTGLKFSKLRVELLGVDAACLAPRPTDGAAVPGAVKARPGNAGGCLTGRVPAGLDSPLRAAA
jgi:hypothetical protein